MKAILIAAMIAVAGAPALAQDRLVRADASGTLGWFNAHKTIRDPYNDWYSDSLIAEAGFGWYWTDHWKTEVSTAASTAAESFGTTLIAASSPQLYLPSRLTFSTRRVSVTQHYQFGDNEWFHPYLAAGLDGVWQRTGRRDEPVYQYDAVTRQSRLVREALDHPLHTRAALFGAGAAGFKTYFARRAFFRSELRVMFTDRVEEVVLRFGFGVDF